MNSQTQTHYTDGLTVARRLGVDPRTVVRMIANGDLRGVKVNGQKRRWQVEIESVEAYLRRTETFKGEEKV